MKGTLIFSNISAAAESRRETLDGLEHLVFPVVAIKEGVLNNIFYPASELENFVNNWNGVPVPVSHPKDRDGSFVTANSVECEEKFNIGKFFNVKFEDKAIKGEIWVNIAKAVRLGFSNVIEKLETNQTMEVSTGLFAHTLAQGGTYEGKAYEATIYSIRPDHLALLPNEIGACSVSMGCGTHLNSSKLVTNCGCQTEQPKPLGNRLLSLMRGWLFGNEQGHNEIRDALNRAIQATIGKNQWAWIANIFDDYVIYELESKLYKQTYAIDNGNAILVGEAVEVKVETSYTPVSVNTTQTTMNPNRKTAVVLALASLFAANAAAPSDAEKKPFNDMSDDMLNNMLKTNKLEFDDNGNKVVANATPVTPPPLPVQAPVAPPAPVVNQGAGDPLGASERAMLQRLLANETARLVQKREILKQANPNLTDAILANLDEAALDAFLPNAQQAQAPVYGLNGFVPAPVVTNGANDPYRTPERPKVLTAPVQ